eukprot:m.75658 g.75658  ORF g.75658 m.75658 type:complete len:1079 (-) comp9010_c0_seq1:104-3340(-)
MRVNLKHVGLIATSHPHLNYKTGWLRISEKGSAAGEAAFKDRWVVLKGNFLFYFRKEVQHASELVGCILLEKFRLRVSNEEQFEFAISFEQYSQTEIAFRANSNAELRRWREMVATCCHEYTRAVHALVAKRSEAFGLKPLAFDPMKTYQDGTPMEQLAYADYQALGPLQAPKERDIVKVFKLAISAQGLKGDRNSPLQPSCYVKVQVKYVSWIDYLPKTDVKRETDPTFATEVTFRYNDSLGPKLKQTHVRFIVYMDNGASGSMVRSQSGSTQKRDYSAFRPAALAECRLQDVCDSEDKHLTLPLLSYGNANVKLKSSITLRLVVDDVHDPAAAASGGTTVRLGKKIEGPIYKFATIAGAPHPMVRATEVMGESAFFRIMPEALLKIFVEEDRRLIDQAASVGQALSETVWAERVLPWFEHINLRLKMYIDHMTTLSSHPLYFRKSVDKKSRELEMTGLNVHIQRMNVLEAEGTGIAAMYDTVTHGAPAAHALGFKHGGLRSILAKEGRNRGALWNEVDGHVRKLRRCTDSVGAALEKLEARFPAAGGESGTTASMVTHAAASEPRAPAPTRNASMMDTASGTQTPTYETDPAAAASPLDASAFNPAYVPASPARPNNPGIGSGNSSKPVRNSDSFFGASDYATLEDALSDAKAALHVVNNDFVGPALHGTVRLRASNEDATPLPGSPTRKTRGAPHVSGRARDARQITVAIEDAIAYIDRIKTECCAGEITMGLRELHTELLSALYEVDVASLLTAIAADPSDEVVHRRDVAFSQACTCLITSFVTTLVNRRKDEKFLQQLYNIGFLVHFESLLSTQGKELGMIEDMSVAVEDLRGVSFRLERAPDDVEPYSRVFVQGSRYRVCITLEVPSTLYERLPANVIDSGSGLISVMPVFFSHGVNEMQTLANRLGETEVQDEIVSKGIEDLAAYCKAYSGFVQRVDSHAAAVDTTATLGEMLNQLQTAVRSDKAKNISILTLSEDIARKVKGGRLTCCKSGKDRTGMSVTLEQARILIERHQMDPEKLQEALHLMRSMGTRMDNVEKNIGQRKYAFNKIQVYALPKMLRPPLVNIGGTIT